MSKVINTNKVFSEKEILEEITNILSKKEETLTVLCDRLKIDSFELFGYIKKLKDRGINIILNEKDNDTIFSINNAPDYTKENLYVIEEDYDSTTKIGVIDNLRFGSKYEQISMLNEIYKNFAKEGVKYVIVCGNLTEGKYSGNAKVELLNSLITNDALGQASHLVKYFPKVEGIKTLFITGQTDRTWNKELNIGKYIDDNREDMTYLGPKGCTIKFNNVIFRVESLKKSGEAYTIAYPPQRYSRSLPSYEDYDVILLGGTATIQDFPKLRDSRIFAVPSCVARTPKMKENYQQNAMGAMIIELEYTKAGDMKRILPTVVPYYRPKTEIYRDIVPLNMKLDEENNLVNNKTRLVNGKLYDSLNKIYKYIKKEQTFNELKERLNMSENSLMGILDMLSLMGKPVEITDVNGELVVYKRQKAKVHNTVKPPKEELNVSTFGVVSDTHYGSIWCQPSMVNTFAYVAYNRGITDMLHIGDISDGDYSRIRPNHVHEVFLYGATGQKDYVLEHLPKYKGMTWRVICGSHDQTHLFNYGMDFGKTLAEERNDIIYLGQDKATINYGNCEVELFHPGGGCARILSSKPQNGIDQFESNHKPNMIVCGHYHKVYGMLYRNVLEYMTGCNVDQSSYMMKNQLPNIMSNCFVTLWYDNNGDIQYYTLEPMVFSSSDVTEKDYLKPKKYIKNKILTLSK